MLHPTTSLEYLGFVVDSQRQSFLVPQRKIISWTSLREEILARRKFVDVKTLQCFQGKCISFSLVVPAAKLFIRERAPPISSASSNGQVLLSPGLRGKIIHWRFLDSWKDCVPWRDEKRLRLSVSSDASGDRILGDYWQESQRSLNISTKEMLAPANTLEALPQDISNCRVDASVDSCVLIGAWEGEGSKKSPAVTMATKHLFSVLTARNIQLNLKYVPSGNNEADGPSHRVSRSDSRLSKKVWDLVDRTFGGEDGHSVALMALHSSAMLGKTGVPLPHLSLHPSPKSKGTNLFC